uniref:Uncharacterized protein n=1 Tax=Solanum tuberosum TaxID=4113 RepID=M1DD84_SOLTU
MAKSKVAGRSKPPQDRTKGITTSKDADTFRSKVAKLSETCEKRKGKQKAFEISDRVERRVKRRNDSPRFRTPRPTITAPPVPSLTLVLVPLIQGPQSKSNREKAEALRTILEEKCLSIDGVIDRYPER